MKTTLFTTILILISIFTSAQPAQQIRLQNESECTVFFNVACTTDECGNLTFNSATYSMAPGLGDTIAFCNPSADFAALRFYFPDGDNIAHYITFNPQADPFCAGQEGCNELFPWMYEGNIESNCLGAQGAVRADYFSEYQRCTIYFQHND